MTHTAVVAKPRVPTRVLIERGSATAILALVAIWLTVNFIESPTQFATMTLLGLKNGALYALIALGYTLVYGIIELINFAHGDLFMLSTVFSAYMMVRWLEQTTVSTTGYLSFLATLLCVMAFAAFINVTIEFLAYRRLRKAPRLAPLITAVGVSFILQFIGLQWNGSGVKTWPSALPQGEWLVAGVKIEYSEVIIIAVTAPILLALTYVVQKTKQGKAMRATAQDQDAARLMGVNVNRTISFTFALGGALAGAAGLMWAQTIGSTSYNLGFQLGLIAFTSAVLGGIGNLTGAVIGALLIGLIQGLNDGLPFALGQKWSQSLVFTILILLMVFKPEGIMGKATTEKV